MDGYSRLVAFLQVFLPLLALAILSTLFLLSRNINTDAAIPFAESEIEDRVRDQLVTGPFYSGQTTRGDRIAISATTLAMPDGGGSVSTANEVTAQIDLAQGGRIIMTAQTGVVDMPAKNTTFEGDVLITTTSGYRIRSDALISTLGALEVTSPGAISATGPIGDLESGQFRLTSREDSNAVHLLFTEGVKLIYQPKPDQE